MIRDLIQEPTPLTLSLKEMCHCLHLADPKVLLVELKDWISLSLSVPTPV